MSCCMDTMQLRSKLGSRLAANLSTLFTELPFLERFDAAAQAGFRFVEFQFPYAFNFSDIRAAMDAAGVGLVMHNFPPGDWEAGERGLAVELEQERFWQSVALGLRAAQALGTPRMNCLAGIVAGSAEKSGLRDTMVVNFRYAAASLVADGRDLLIEPLNDRDLPGFALNRATDVLHLLDEIAAENAYLQLDIYHASMMGEDICKIIETRMNRIGHVQFADMPGRHEPGSGDIDFAAIFDCLAANGYLGQLGCEYFPRGETLAGLAWRQDLFGD
jgi:hydroxypyruvate isomerase